MSKTWYDQLTPEAIKEVIERNYHTSLNDDDQIAWLIYDLLITPEKYFDEKRKIGGIGFDEKATIHKAIRFMSNLIDGLVEEEIIPRKVFDKAYLNCFDQVHDHRNEILGGIKDPYKED